MYTSYMYEVQRRRLISLDKDGCGFPAKALTLDDEEQGNLLGESAYLRIISTLNCLSCAVILDW
jgi:hypothetical protein